MPAGVFSADRWPVAGVIEIERSDRACTDVLRHAQRAAVATVPRPRDRSGKLMSSYDVRPESGSRSDPGGKQMTIDLTVLIPTFNERDNISPLVTRISDACAGHQVEILFIDDSSDDTPEVIERTARTSVVPVRLIHRSGADRVGGLAGAVTAGLGQALGRYVVVMDGDLQHPPELVPVLREIANEPGVQLVVGARYRGRGPAVGLDGAWRRWVSNWSTVLARTLFPRRVGRKCSDPMTGFFCIDRQALDPRTLRPRGFKILLEILVRNDLVVREMPFVFEERTAGNSKASLAQGVAFARQLLQLRYDAS